MNPGRRDIDLAAILDEISAVFRGAEPGIVDALVAELDRARHILVHSAGRAGLVMRGFAMRLYHLGLSGHVVGDMTTPPVGPGDLLVVNASTGDLPSGIAHLRGARKAGARTVVISAARAGEAHELADRVLVLPAQTMLDDATTTRPSLLPMGSQYELALFLLTEIAVVDLARRRGISFLEMRRRHANLL